MKFSKRLQLGTFFQNVRSFLYSLALLLFFFTSTAQTTDKVKYYIAYDRSGSVGILDRNNNLQEMFLYLLNVTTQNKKALVNSPVIFGQYNFGGNPNRIQDSVFYYDPNGKPVTIEKLVKLSDTSRKQHFTHMHVALDTIAEQIERDNGEDSNKTSSGVFIFTDRKLQPGDIDWKNLNIKSEYKTDTGYQKYLDSLIRRLWNLTSGNVFVVLTSPKYESSDVSLDSALALDHELVRSDAYIRTSNLFWLSSKQVFKDSAQRNVKAFDDFVQDANLSIVAPKKLPPKDNVAVAISSFELLNFPAISRDSCRGNYKPICDSLKKLSNILSKDSLTKDLIDSVKKIIENLKNKAKDVVALKDTLIKNGISKKNDVFSLLLPETYRPSPTTRVLEVKNKKGFETWQETLIIGLTDYIIQRVKQEAIYSFLESINDKLFEGRPLIKDTLFPNVGDLLAKKDYFLNLPVLRSALEADLRALPDQINLNSELIKSDGLYTLICFLNLYKHLSQTGNLERSFNRLTADLDSRFNSAISNTKNVIVNKAIKLTANLIGWLEKYDLAKAYANRDSLENLSKILVVLFLDEQGINSINIKQAAKLVKSIFEQYIQTKQEIVVLQELMNQPPVADIDGYRKYLRDLLMDILHRSSDLMLSGISLIETIKYDTSIKFSYNDAETIERDKIKTDKIIRQASKSVDAWFMLKEGDYAKAAYELAPDLVLLLDKLDKKVPKDSLMIEKFQNFIYIAGEVCTAKNSADITNIIARYSLPVASYRIKQSSPRTLMLTAYPGVGGILYQSDRSLTPGIVSPVGLEFSFHIKKVLHPSIMATLLDLGNIIDYRLAGNKKDSGVVSVERIFSPGFLFTLSFKGLERLPLRFITGYQWNPKRFMAGISFDLPLIAFWKQQR